jgi:hypothetical protein
MQSTSKRGCSKLLRQDKIYLIQRIGFQIYKIGKTQEDPLVRLQSIEAEVIRDGLFNDGSPVKLELIHSFNVSAPFRAEPGLHRYFSNQRIRFGPPCILPEREWFTLTDAHVAFIKTLTDDNYLDLISIGTEVNEWGFRTTGRAAT